MCISISSLIKDLFVGLAILFIGSLMNFDWFFWLLVLLYVLRPFIDALKDSLDHLAEKLRQYNLKNRPPH